MAQTMVNFRMDEDLKKNMESTCKELGMNMSTAFIIFAKKVAREKRIPFDVSVDPFYSEENMKRLEKIISDIDSGKTKLVLHELNDIDYYEKAPDVNIGSFFISNRCNGKPLPQKEAPRPLCIRTGCLYMMLENVSNLNRVGAMN